MNEPKVCLAAPIFSVKSVVFFSAYGFGWGYRTYAMSTDVLCNEFGAQGGSDSELLPAFELAMYRIVDVVKSKPLPESGEVTRLFSADFSSVEGS